MPRGERTPIVEMVRDGSTIRVNPKDVEYWRSQGAATKGQPGASSARSVARPAPAPETIVIQSTPVDDDEEEFDFSAYTVSVLKRWAERAGVTVKNDDSPSSPPKKLHYVTALEESGWTPPDEEFQGD